MDIRSLVKAGIASYTVSLPKAWIEKNKLQKGDSLYITEKSHNELIISTEIKEKTAEIREITITTDNKKHGTIRREITSAYVNNYNTIIILGKDLEQKAKEIRRFLHDFVALEIEEQTTGKIVAKDLLNLKEISIEKTIRRVDMIIRSMIDDSIKSIDNPKLAEGISYRDFDINRFYFLLFRLIKSSLTDAHVAASFNLSNTKAMEYWYLIINLEEMGDSVKNLCNYFNDLSEKEKYELKGIYQDIQKDYLEVIKAYYNKNKESADKVASNRDLVLSRLNQFLNKFSKLNIAEILGLLREIETNVSTIARIVIDS